MTFDYERFALSSRESYMVALSERKEFGVLSWPLLKFYYSSFFAAHSIMRSRGAGVVKLDRKQTDFLSDLVQLHDAAAPRIGPGMYSFRRDHAMRNATGEISIALRHDVGGGGVHESFWIIFCEFLDFESKRAVLQALPDAQDFVALAAELKEAILGRGGASWISSVRNRINYQHDFETWMPYRKGSLANKAVPNAAPNRSALRLDHSKDTQTVQAFLNVSCYLSELGAAVGEFIALRSTRGGAFGQKWKRLEQMLAPVVQQ